MLSRVAERLYWSARYLERVENIARLLRVYDELMLDLPRTVRISWYHLIEINSSVAEFSRKYQDHGERSVVTFLISDRDNPSSILSSLKMVRENIRTTRDVVPEEMWELINELDLYAKNNAKKGACRSDRHSFLTTLIEGCQKIIGLLVGAMSRDAGWNFTMLGRYLERTDMNTRILDSAVRLLMQYQGEERVHLEQVIWLKVLRSQSAYLNYRRSTHASVSGEMAITFLLMDRHFPRSQLFCLTQLKEAATSLPRAETVLNSIASLLSEAHAVTDPDDINIEFSCYLNDVQLSLIDLHKQISDSWFHFQHGEAA